MARKKVREVCEMIFMIVDGLLEECLVRFIAECLRILPRGEALSI